jgi:hypothetical protein
MTMTMLGVDLNALQKRIDARPMNTRGEVVATTVDSLLADVYRRDLRTGEAETWVERPFQHGKPVVEMAVETAARVTFKARCWLVEHSFRSAEVFSTILPGACTSLDPRDVATYAILVSREPGVVIGGHEGVAAVESDRIRLAKHRWAIEMPRRVAAMKAVLSLSPEPDAPTPATDDD